MTTDKKMTEDQEIIDMEQELEQKVEEASRKAEENIEELKDQLLRALAEMENVRKRAARDREEASIYATTSFARSLLSVADNLRRALETLPQEKIHNLPNEVQSFVEGVQITETELLSIFEKNGIKKIVPMGEPFDHSFHQAMFEIEATDQPAGTIVEVLQPGYILHDRLLRPAMVGVAKARREGNNKGE